MVLARPQARSTTKIRSKSGLYPHNHFTEHLVVTYEKSPWKSDLNHESSSLLFRRLKSYTASPCNGSHKITKIEFCKLKLDSWLTLPGFERQKLKNDECTRERASWCAPLEIDKKRAAGERVKKREPAPRRAARVN
jgi:hypothetical protein